LSLHIAGLARDHDKKLFEKAAKKETAAEPAKVEAPPPMPPPFPTEIEAPSPVPVKAPTPETEPRKDFVSPKSSGYGSFIVRPDRETI